MIKKSILLLMIFSIAINAESARYDEHDVKVYSKKKYYPPRQEEKKQVNSGKAKIERLRDKKKD